MLAKILIAIMIVEGGPGAPPGDDGKALGPFQIHRAYWEDGCKHGGVEWDYKTGALELEKSIRVVCWYWQRWCPRAYKDLDAETLVRTHNGGPTRVGTDAYWLKVKAVMDWRTSDER